MTKKIGFFFDLDGTLIDSADDLLNACYHAFGDKKNPTLNNLNFKRNVALGARAMLKAMKPDSTEIELDSYQTRFLDYYNKNIDVHSKFYSGLDTLLIDLAKKESASLKHGIITNKSTVLSNLLLKKLLPEWQGLVIGNSTTTTLKAKPSPDRLLYAFKECNINPQDCYYFGDYQSDIDAAKAAGCVSVAVEYGFHDEAHSPSNWNADVLIKSPAVVIEFINSCIASTIIK